MKIKKTIKVNGINTKIEEIFPLAYGYLGKVNLKKEKFIIEAGLSNQKNFSINILPGITYVNYNGKLVAGLISKWETGTNLFYLTSKDSIPEGKKHLDFAIRQYVK